MYIVGWMNAWSRIVESMVNARMVPVSAARGGLVLTALQVRKIASDR